VIPSIFHGLYHQAEEWDSTCPHCGNALGPKSASQLRSLTACYVCSLIGRPVPAPCPFPHETAA